MFFFLFGVGRSSSKMEDALFTDDSLPGGESSVSTQKASTSRGSSRSDNDDESKSTF